MSRDLEPRKRVVHKSSDKIITQRDDAAPHDLNKIVAQFLRSGAMPAVALRNPLYGDFSNFPIDPHEAREQMEMAEDRFMQLPAPVRTAARNDWTTFLEMFGDPEGRALLEEAGLEVAPAPPPAPVAPSEPEPAPAPEPDPPSEPS